MLWSQVKNYFQHCCWLLGRSKTSPQQVTALDTLKTSLQELSSQLDNPTVTAALISTPAKIISPVIQGLQTVLQIVKNSLTELLAQRDDVSSLQELLANVNNLLTVSASLTPSKEEALESVKIIANTLQDLPSQAEINETINLIDKIVSKLEAL